MRVRILGAAAGGGYPQWNCNCPVCHAAREGAAQPLTQSSIAVRSGDDAWVLVNASPDLRQQLADLPFDRDRDGALRSTPVGAVVLTDAEIDHTAGLLLLRESSEPLLVYSTQDVRVALTEHYPVLKMLERYCGVRWRELVPGHVTTIEGTALEVEPFVTGGDAPLYMGDAEGPTSVGLTIREPGAGTLSYAPALAELDDELTARLRDSDCVLADGTFWVADELVGLGLSTRDSWAMGHAPLTGAGGTLEPLSHLGPRTVLVHINNSNPILLDASPQRAQVQAHGIEVAHDGLEVVL
jgi:pyrroloquinoline quinone biosynthesis protein B